MKNNFDTELKKRKKQDDSIFSNAFFELSSAIMGKSEIAAQLKDDTQKTRNAVSTIFDYYHLTMPEPPSKVKDWNVQLSYYLQKSGLMHRTVKLKGEWYNKAIGPLLGHVTGGGLVALIPKNLHYEWYDYQEKKWIRVNEKNVSKLGVSALCFYEPLPNRAMDTKDLIRFMVKQPLPSDYYLVIVIALCTTLMGLLIPYLTQYIFAVVIPNSSRAFLIPVACLLFGTVFSSVLLGINKKLINSRIGTKINMALDASAMFRVLSMPPAFFRKFSAGELAQRLSQLTEFSTTLVSVITVGGLSSLFSLLYYFQIFSFSAALAAPAAIILGITLLLTVVSAFYQQRISKKINGLNAHLAGIVYGLISGMSKIKLAGAEKRAFGYWAETYSKSAALTYNPPLLLKLSNILPLVISSAGLVLIYTVAAQAQVSTADYMAFTSAYGMVSGSITALSMMVGQLASLRPALEMAEPILKNAPESVGNRQIPHHLKGRIVADNLTFRYNAEGAPVLNALSLTIDAGEYLAIVGQTGCGKSTLLRLLLGFEKPLTGAVYYDDQNIENLDLKLLRQKIGTVMQNGRLISGSIYQNIILSAPWLTLDDAWQAAEVAGIADDIRRMPMGMHTVLSDGGGGLSGGQQQRILIARAIAPSPAILMFDEATSALDNTTQKQVSDALDALNCTRIVIAHRLSTIRNCDRILVLGNGKVQEQGTYDALIKKGGLFYELVKRQQI